MSGALSTGKLEAKKQRSTPKVSMTKRISGCQRRTRSSEVGGVGSEERPWPATGMPRPLSLMAKVYQRYLYRYYICDTNANI